MIQSVFVEGVRACFPFQAPIFVCQAEKQLRAEQLFEYFGGCVRFVKQSVFGTVEQHVLRDLGTAVITVHLRKPIENDDWISLPTESVRDAFDLVQMEPSWLRVDLVWVGLDRSEVLLKVDDSSEEKVSLPG